MAGPLDHLLRLCRLALMRFRYLCFDIFLRRFFTSEPMQKPLWERGKTCSWSRGLGARSTWARDRR